MAGNPEALIRLVKAQENFSLLTNPPEGYENWLREEGAEHILRETLIDLSWVYKKYPAGEVTMTHPEEAQRLETAAAATFAALLPEIYNQDYAVDILPEAFANYTMRNVLLEAGHVEFILANTELKDTMLERQPEFILLNHDKVSDPDTVKQAFDTLYQQTPQTAVRHLDVLDPQSITDLLMQMQPFPASAANALDYLQETPEYMDYLTVLYPHLGEEDQPYFKGQVYQAILEDLQRSDYTLLSNDGVQSILQDDVTVSALSSDLTEANIVAALDNRVARKFLLLTALEDGHVAANLLDHVTLLSGVQDQLEAVTEKDFQTFLEEMTTASEVVANNVFNERVFDKFAALEEGNSIDIDKLILNILNHPYIYDAKGIFIKELVGNNTYLHDISCMNEALSIAATSGGINDFHSNLPALRDSKIVTDELLIDIMEQQLAQTGKRAAEMILDNKKNLEGVKGIDTLLSKAEVYRNESYLEALKPLAEGTTFNDPPYSEQFEATIKQVGQFTNVDDATQALFNALGVQDRDYDGQTSREELLEAIYTHATFNPEQLDVIREKLLEAGKELALAAQTEGYGAINAQETSNTELGNLSLVTRIVNEELFDGKAFSPDR